MRLDLTHFSFLRALAAHSEAQCFRSPKSTSPPEKKFVSARRIKAICEATLVILFACLMTRTASARAIGAPAQLTSPTPTSVLPGSSVTFQWSAGTNVEEY